MLKEKGWKLQLIINLQIIFLCEINRRELLHMFMLLAIPSFSQINDRKSDLFSAVYKKCQVLMLV